MGRRPELEGDVGPGYATAVPLAFRLSISRMSGRNPHHPAMSFSLTSQEVSAALPLVAPGLAKFLRIMEIAATVPGFYDDPEFRRHFNGFYRVRRSAATWQPHFFALMGRAKAGRMGFAEILAELYCSTGMVEASFASKLYATLVPTAPVIDSVVLANLGLELPSAKDPDLLAKVAEVHRELASRFAWFLATEEGAYAVAAFRKAYPGARVTDVKALDLMLWQTR